MPRFVLALALIASMSSAGCILQNLAPTQQLQDRMFSLNDQTRWGRIDLAAQQVVPAFRAAFVLSRREWGHRIAVADTDVSALVIADDGNSATSTVEITWYDQDTLDLRGTVLRQHWAKTDAGFLLDEESVVSGDEELLASPEDEEDDDGEEGETASRSEAPSRG